MKSQILGTLLLQLKILIFFIYIAKCNLKVVLYNPADQKTKQLSVGK